jgi:hypothetical protein
MENKILHVDYVSFSFNVKVKNYKTRVLTKKETILWTTLQLNIEYNSYDDVWSYEREAVCIRMYGIVVSFLFSAIVFT